MISSVRRVRFLPFKPAYPLLCTSHLIPHLRPRKPPTPYLLCRIRATCSGHTPLTRSIFRVGQCRTYIHLCATHTKAHDTTVPETNAAPNTDRQLATPRNNPLKHCAHVGGVPGLLASCSRIHLSRALAWGSHHMGLISQASASPGCRKHYKQNQSANCIFTVAI